MITKIEINDSYNTPIDYTGDVFKKPLTVDFIDGVNIIVGENGCGKTTLLKLLRYYLMVDEVDCGRGMYNCNVTRLMDGFRKGFPTGVDIYGDYERNVFNLTHHKSTDAVLKDFDSFGEEYEKKHSSTGESVIIALNALFKYMFKKGTPLKFDYSSIERDEYQNYVKSHRVKCAPSWTLLMDEPDRNLSLTNLKYIEDVLSYKKENTQVIATIHNPLLIMSLQKFSHINWIELSEDYLSRINEIFDKRSL